MCVLTLLPFTFPPLFMQSIILLFSFPKRKLYKTGQNWHFLACFPFSHHSRALGPPSLTYLIMRRSLTGEMARGRTRTRIKPCSRKSRRRIWKSSVNGKRPFSKLRLVIFSRHSLKSSKCRFLVLRFAQRDEGNADLYGCLHSIMAEIIRCF